MNQLGMQKLGIGRSPVSRHSTQRYNMTYYRLTQWEPLIALSHTKGSLNLCICGASLHGGGRGGGARGEGVCIDTLLMICYKD